jgi:hypothetical protein
MVAQYVFFRDSAGKAAKRGDGKHVPTHMLANMGESSVLQEGGRIGWKGWFHQHEALLTSFIVLGPDGVELNDGDTKGIIWKAFEDVAKRARGKALNANEVLNTADHHAAEFFRQTPNEYILVASLSIKAFPGKKIAIRGCEITPLARREPRYPLPKVLQSAQHRNYFAEHLKNSRYQLVKVSCSGRTVYEGVGNALDRLNLLRALWSFTATYGRHTMRLGGGPRKPIGVIHTGAVYTLHNPDGSAANDEIYWFDPDYTRDQDLFWDEGKWPKLEADRRWAMRKLASVPYKRDMEEILLRYIAALDQANPNVAFLQLWGVLEKITNTVGAKYDETIDRTCWVFGKSFRKVMKETLESLRHHRNRYVHAGNAGHESEDITYRIKSFVDPHIGRLLNNTFQVKTMQEYGEFLGYPTNIETLERIRTWSTRALRAAREDEKEEAKANTQSA